MALLLLDTPNEKQKKFLQCRTRNVGFGGARGGGKSWAIRTKAKLLVYRYPGIKVLIVRRTYNELFENHINPLCEELHVYDQDRSKRLAKYNDSKKHLVFPNGSRIIFRYCENDKDAERFQGTEVDVLFIDEATHQTEERVRKLTACVRGTGKYPRRVYYTFNPGGVGHAWVKRLFIDRNFKPGETPEDYEFIQSLVTDNKALMQADPDYIRQLEALPPKLREAWLYGKWDVFEGQVFEEFRNDPDHYIDRRFSHVIQPFIVPETWRIFRSFDWGYSRPFSVGWYAVDHENRVYRIAEFYGCTQTANEGVKYEPAKLAKAIAEIEAIEVNLKGRDIVGVADPAIFSEEKGESIAETMSRAGVYFEPADHTRLAGLMQCHYRLSFDENGIPMFYVFSNCKHFIRTIPMLLYDEKKVEDVDTSLEDHIYDEWRYCMMENPMNPPVHPKPVKDIRDDPLDLYKDSMMITDYTRYDYIRY